MSLDLVYFVIGLVLIAFSFMTWRDTDHSKRLGTAAFWLIYGISFMFGSLLPDLLVGLMVVTLTIIASTGFLGTGNYQQREESERRASSKEFGNKLFIPAALIPVLTFIWAKTVGNALIGLGVASVVALIVALLMTRGSVGSSMQEGRRQIDAISWAAILSQFLAASGSPVWSG